MSRLGEQIYGAINAIADGAVTANRFVKRSATGPSTVEDCDTQGEGASGVAWAGAADGEAVRVIRDGVALVEAGAAITAGASIMTDNVGRAITATATNKILGKVTEAASGPGDFIHAELQVGYPEP